MRYIYETDHLIVSCYSALYSLGGPGHFAAFLYPAMLRRILSGAQTAKMPTSSERLPVWTRYLPINVKVPCDGALLAPSHASRIATEHTDAGYPAEIRGRAERAGFIVRSAGRRKSD